MVHDASFSTNCLLTAPAISSTSSWTNTPSSPILTAIPTGEIGSPCCYIWPKFVGLGEWYNKSITATVATVVTQFLQYNNTIVKTSTTVFNESAMGTRALGLQFLLENDIYGFVRPLTATKTVISGTTL
jgi:hypothetical protein